MSAFATLATLDGYDVIDAESGRPIAHRDSHASANGVAFRLNETARSHGVAAAMKVAGRIATARPDDEGDALLDFDPWMVV